MNQTASPSKTEAFVTYLSNALTKDKGLAARVRKADNPATEHLCWELLAKFNIDLEKPYQRSPYSLVAAAMAKSRTMKQGSISLGAGLRIVYREAEARPSEPAAQALARLRRILSCSSTEELCRVLRPVLTLINSRLNGELDYTRLLNQLLRFHFDPNAVQAQIAQDFYSYGSSNEEAVAEEKQ